MHELCDAKQDVGGPCWSNADPGCVLLDGRFLLAREKWGQTLRTRVMPPSTPKRTSPGPGISQPNSSDHHAAESQWNLLASVLVLDLRATPFNDIAHILENEDRKRRHALPLFGTERLVEWLPRFGEFIQIG
jgi:hypothetical protein